MIPPAQRLAGVNYSIRRVAVEGKKTEAAGKRIHWLNTGDPIAFGFRTPAHMVAAVEKVAARRRERLRAFVRASGSARSDRRRKHDARLAHLRPIASSLTAGSSEGIDFALTALADPGDEVLLPRPTYPLYTAVSHKIGARDVYYRHRSQKRLAAGSQRDPQAHHAAHQGAGRERPEQPDRRGVSGLAPPRAAEHRRSSTA